jgi:hypothetical protein
MNLAPLACFRNVSVRRKRFLALRHSVVEISRQFPISVPFACPLLIAPFTSFSPFSAYLTNVDRQYFRRLRGNAD